jgi:hypothetical protein
MKKLIAAPVLGASKLAAGTLLGAGAKAVIPKTAAGRLGAGVAAGGVAGAGKSEDGIGSEEFRHSVKAGMAGGALGQAGFGLGKLVIGKTGKIAGGLSRAIGGAASKVEKAGFIPKLMVKTAKAKIPKVMSKGFDKAIKLMEAGDLPPNQAGILMKGMQSGGAGLAGAYVNLINNDVEFARAMEAGEIKPAPGKLGDFVPKTFTEESKSTIGGRLQAGLDDLIGAESIGLDPGEKIPSGQPTDDDRAAMALVPLFAGITKKVTSLNPEKIKELLEKKGKKLSGVDEERLRILNKPGMSQARKDKLIDRINEGIQGKGEGSVKDIPSGKMRFHDDTLEELTAKLDNLPRTDPEFSMIEGEIQRRLKIAKDGGIRRRSSKGNKAQEFLDKIRKKEIVNDFHEVVWRDAKKSHVVPWDKPPVNGEMAPDVKHGIGDMFNWTQDKHGLTKDYLKKHGDKIKTISTRSDLIAHDDYAELIPKDAVVKIHLASAPDRVAKIMEPGAPSLGRRLKAIEKLKKKGKNVEVVFDVPQENGQTVSGAWRGMNEVRKFAKEKGIRLEDFRIRRNHIDVTGKKGEGIRKILGEEYFEQIKKTTPSDMLKQIDEDLKSGKIKNIKKDED